MSVFQKVLQLPMSYDCLTHMLTHPLRDYMFGLRGGLFRRGLTRGLRGSIRYCPHRNCLREPFVASFPFILAFLFTSSFLQSSGILPNLSDLTRETLRNMLANKKLTPAYADLSFPYAGRPYDKAPT